MPVVRQHGSGPTLPGAQPEVFPGSPEPEQSKGAPSHPLPLAALGGRTVGAGQYK